jgi:hypothetical protein
VNVRFDCPVCDTPGGRLDTEGAAEWRCPKCDHVARLTDPSPNVPVCAACGNHELFVKKDFPHSLGMTILVLALIASTVTYLFYEKWLTWAILIGSAAFDGLLYLWVKDVIVCYRCHAHHRAFAANHQHKPFELTIHERYRQERMLIQRDEG